METIAAPYGREVWLTEVDFESGMRLLRVTVREGSRYTILELDPATASRWGQSMISWAAAQTKDSP
ncbi:MAG: hypothetical protein HY852_16020 [Bradyrhizobium sp.]|nr:hypothetical protein [Bradyrhizobium sp.]